MRSYNKLILWMLVILVVINITACNSVVKYQNSIFHDKSKIVREGDSYTYKSKIGNGRGDEYDIKFTSFSGMETIYMIESDGENDVIVAFEAIVKDGEFKVVLITPDDEIINIVNGTDEGNKTIKIKEGVNRIKLVGKKAKGDISIKIHAEDGVKIKKID